MQDNSKFMRGYSDTLKKQVLKELEEGASRGSLQRKYAIGGNDTINKWIRKAGKLHLLNYIVQVDIAFDKVNEPKVKEVSRVIPNNNSIQYRGAMTSVSAR